MLKTYIPEDLRGNVIDFPDGLTNEMCMEPWMYRDEWLKGLRKVIRRLRLAGHLYPRKRYFPETRDGSIANRRAGVQHFPPNFIADMCARYLLKVYNRNHMQGNYCFCPGCGLELCRSDSWFSDTDLVRYKCIQCGAQSGWLFDAPAPILIEGKRERRRMVEAPEWATHFFCEHEDAGGVVPYLQEIPK